MSTDKIPASPRERLLQGAYRIGYRLALAGWWLRRPRHHGALVALWAGGRLLVVRQSYRPGFSLPGGGVQRGETARHAAQRELQEELGLDVDATSLTLTCTLRGRWDYRRDQVDVFTLHLPAEPEPRPDRREIIEARFLPVEILARERLSAPLHAYLHRAGTGAGIPPWVRVAAPGLAP